jgi:hypothetical protein
MSKKEHDYDRLKIRTEEPTEAQIAILRGIVGGALFTFLGYIHLEFPDKGQRLLHLLEKFEQDHGFDFDQADARFWDDVVKANFAIKAAKQKSPAQPKG